MANLHLEMINIIFFLDKLFVLVIKSSFFLFGISKKSCVPLFLKSIKKIELILTEIFYINHILSVHTYNTVSITLIN